MRVVLVVAGAAALATAVACGKPSSEQSAPAGGAGAGAGGRIDTAQAKEIFNSRCANCHGPNGDGNGPAAVALSPKPRNYHDKEWQKKVTDDELRKTITYGGAAVGKSPVMPANPDLESKPEVLAGLVGIVRDFGK